MLPALNPDTGSLADVLPSTLRALGIDAGPARFALPTVDSAIVLVADGLGRTNLMSHAGHARTLARAEGWTIQSAFPTTTAAGLTTIMTGQLAGAHGMLGYETLDPASRTVRNNLTGEGSPTEPEIWQPVTPLFALAGAAGVRPLAVTDAKFAGSAFTRAKLRGADFEGASRFADRVDLALAAVRQSRSLVYLYTADVDHAGHVHGGDSEQWVAELEAVDAEVARLVSELPPRVGLLVTADHGQVDVPGHRHRIVPADSPLMRDVDVVAGEPRALQLYRRPGVDDDAWAETVERWHVAEGSRAWIATRDEVQQAGWFGDFAADHAQRFGDLVVLARGRYAYYADPDDTARSMIGQHGSLTPEEVRVPLLRYGAFAENSMI